MRLATASAGTVGLTLSAPDGVEVDQAARTITGLAVPYGKPGQTNLGVLTFSPGSLKYGDPRRIKLLLEHDQTRDVIGYATRLEDTEAGLLATFHVPEGEAGTAALTSAAAGLRDGLSVGAQLDERTNDALRRNRGGAVAASGLLREVSLVSVPAFDDARVASVAASSGALVVSAWADPVKEGTAPMLHDACGQEHALGLPCPATASTGDLATAAGKTGGDKIPTPKDVQDAKSGDPVDPNYTPQEGQVPPNGGGDKPAVVRAAAGMATLAVASEPSVYGFGDANYGHPSRSLVQDAVRAALDGDLEARERMATFNKQLVAGNPASVMALAAVAQTTDMPAGQFINQGYRPDLMVKAVDAGRPIVSRLTRIPITDATPFAIPAEGEFTGVGDHTEGTASVPDGTLTLGGDVVSPKAVSGSYRLSRELIDASNPAIDRIALSAMLRDYRRKSEDKAIAAIVAADASVTLNINTVAELQGELVDFIDDDGQGADFVAMSRTFAKKIAQDVDGNGRPMIAAYPGDAPANGTRSAGQAGEVEGVPLVRAYRMAADTAALVRSSGVLFAESAVQTFRFEQPEGPGIIRLALWAYVGAKVLPTASGGLPNVSRVSIAAA